MKEIAARAGVSVMTVSLALRNHPRITVATRERIQGIAHELGYRPNPMVHALMAEVRARRPVRSTTTLAFVTAFPTRDGWRRNHHVFAENFAGAQERAIQLGYRLEEFWARESGMTGRRLSAILDARNIRGVLIAPVPQARGHLTLDWPKLAAVTLGPSLYRPDLSRATSDHFDSSMMALRRLTKLGYRRIGMVLDRSTTMRTNYAHTAALYQYHRTVPAANRIPALICDRLTEPGYRQWFDRHRPDVIIGMPGLMNWMLKWGMRVPADVGYLDPLLPIWMPWSGIDHHFREVGAAAVDLIVGQLQRNEFGVPAHPKIVTVRSTWVEGNTVRQHATGRTR